MEGFIMRAKWFPTLICLTVSITFQGCPVPTDKDDRLEGEWNGFLISHEAWVLDVRATFADGVLTLEIPGSYTLTISGEYFVDTSQSPMWIDWRPSSGIVRGLYWFDTDPNTGDLNELVMVFNDPDEFRPLVWGYETVKYIYQGVRVVK
jgi:hypothetical protein